MLNDPIFIVGSSGSGAGVLVQALRAAGYSGHNRGHLLSVLPALEHALDGHFQTHGGDPLGLTAHIDALALKEALFLRLRDFVDAHHAGQLWFDRTSGAAMIAAIPALRKMWPDCRFILTKRRGIETIAARLAKSPGSGFEHHCADWARGMTTWRETLNAMPDLPHLEIDHQDIARAPEGAAAALAAILEVPLAVQMTIQEIFENQPRAAEPAAARAPSLANMGWSGQELALFHAYCDAPMAAYSYTEDEGYAVQGAAGIGLYQRAPVHTDPHDPATLSATLGDDKISLPALLQVYIDYQGPIDEAQITQFRRKVTRLNAGGVYLDVEAATAPKAKLGLQILSRGVEGLASHNFYPAGNVEFKRTAIFDAGANELYDPALLPEPFRAKLAMKERPAFSAFTRAGGKLFVGPHQYQYFNDTEGVYFPDASSRQFSKSILENPSRRVSGHIVLIQDCGDGGDFTRFANDWASRILHAMASGLTTASDALFVMRGTPGDFQHALIQGLCEMHGLTEANFLFPESRMILEIDGEFSFFSDQRLHNMHPAQMAHPTSLAQLRALAGRIAGPKGNTERLFISRNDARARRIVNEAELSEIAALRGYKTVELARLPMAEQFTMFRNARRIVGGHGMGFSHLLFCEKRPAVLELFHPAQGTDAYALLAKGYDLPYRHLVGESEDGATLPYRIDPDAFTQLLEEML